MESTLSLTELRQRLFELADQVIAHGGSIAIMRKGVRLVLKREESPEPYSRLAKLKVQELEIGPPIRPDESPAIWQPFVPELGMGVAEPTVSYGVRELRSNRATRVIKAKK
jgi:hypothetical protein